MLTRIEHKKLLEQLSATQKELELFDKLKDPVILHANLLRGFPARLSTEQLLHLLGNKNSYVDHI